MPCGAIVSPVTIGAWKSTLAWASPAPSPGRCHDADAVVAPAMIAATASSPRRGRSMPRRRPSIVRSYWVAAAAVRNTVNDAPWQESFAAPLIAIAFPASMSIDEFAGMSQPLPPLVAVVKDSELRLQL